MTDRVFTDAVVSGLNTKYTRWAQGLKHDSLSRLLSVVHTISLTYAAAREQAGSEATLPGDGMVRAEVSLYSLSRIPAGKMYIGICPDGEIPGDRQAAPFTAAFHEELLHGGADLGWAAALTAVDMIRLLWDAGEFCVRTVPSTAGHDEETSGRSCTPFIAAVRLLQNLYAESRPLRDCLLPDAKGV